MNVVAAFVKTRKFATTDENTSIKVHAHVGVKEELGSYQVDVHIMVRILTHQHAVVLESREQQSISQVLQSNHLLLDFLI